jgi:hypothetical protein
VFERAKTLQIVPDQVGKGGSKTAVHSHQAQPLLDTYYVLGVHVWNQRWTKERLGVAIAGTNQGSVTATKAVHPFYVYSIANANASPDRYILQHDLISTGFNTIWNRTTADMVANYDVECVPASFTNIKNRCFIAWGGTQGLIYDGADAVVIGAIPPATGITGYTITGGDVYSNAVYTARGSAYVICQTIPPSPDWTGADVGKRIVIDGNTYTITAYFDSAAYAPAGTLTNGAGAYIGTVGDVWPDNQYRGAMLRVGGVNQARVASYTTAGGVTTITFQTAVAAAHAGSAYTLVGKGYQLNTTAVADDWTATATVFRASSSASLSWSGNGPQYAIAAYDPVTGHISNISPILTVTEDDQTNVTITLAGFPTQLAAEARFSEWMIFRTLLSGGNVLFPLTGFPGQAINLSSAAPPGTWVDSYPDSTLALSGALAAPQTGGRVGNDKPTITASQDYAGTVVCNGTSLIVRASGPTFSQDFVGQVISIPASGNYTVTGYAQPNKLTIAFIPPTAAFPAAGTRSYSVPAFVLYARPAHMAQWDGRIWMSPVQDPGLILFSADSVQVTFGVPEECYPTLNAMRIPAADGRVNGMRLVGDTLVITTDRYAYYVAGTNESNYRLLRLSTVMYGVGDYQMSELVADGSQEQDGVLFLGRDKKLHVMAPGSGTISVSEPISDRFLSTITTLTNYQDCRVHAGAMDDRRFITARLPGEAHIFDIERRVWNRITLSVLGSLSAVTPDCMTTIYAGSSSPVEEVWAYQGQVGSWLSTVSTLATLTGGVTVFDTDFTGKKSRKRLHFVRIYTSDDWNYSGVANCVNLSPNITFASGTAFGEHLVGGRMTFGLDPYLYTVIGYTAPSTLILNEGFSGTTGAFSWNMVQRWTYSLKVDDTTTYTGNFEAYSNLTFSLYPSGAVPVDGTYAKELLAALPVPFGVPDVGGIMGFRFYLTVNFPANYAPADLFRIDMCYTDEEMDGTQAL